MTSKWDLDADRKDAFAASAVRLVEVSPLVQRADPTTMTGLATPTSSPVSTAPSVRRKNVCPAPARVA